MAVEEEAELKEQGVHGSDRKERQTHLEFAKDYLQMWLSKPVLRGEVLGSSKNKPVMPEKAKSKERPEGDLWRGLGDDSH